MLNLDPTELIEEHRRRFEREAENERLIAQLPASAPTVGGVVRRGLALVCYRLAVWLDAQAGYVQMPEAGPEDWVTPWASV